MVGAFGNLACLQDFKPQPKLEVCAKFLIHSTCLAYLINVIILQKNKNHVSSLCGVL